MHLLDTDTVTHLFQRSNPRVVRAMQALTDPAAGITVVTQIEIMRGRFEASLKAANAAELMRTQTNLSRTEGVLRWLARGSC